MAAAAHAGVDLAGCAQANTAQRWKGGGTLARQTLWQAPPEDCWSVILRGVNLVYDARHNHRLPPDQQQRAKLSYEEVYRQVVTLTDRGEAAWLHQQLQETMDQIARRVRADDCQHAGTLSLEQLLEIWEDHDLVTKKVRDLCSFLEVNWIRPPLHARPRAPKPTATLTVPAMARLAFGTHLLLDGTAEYGKALRAQLLVSVEQHQLGAALPCRAELRRASQLLQLLDTGQYVQYFENPLKQQYLQHACAVRQDLLSGVGETELASPCALYMERLAEELRKLEALGSAAGLPDRTLAALRGQHIAELVTERQAATFLIDSVPGLCARGTESRYAWTLQQLYQRAREAGAAAAARVSDSFRREMQNEGMRLVCDEHRRGDDLAFVEALQRYDSKVRCMLAECFASEPGVAAAVEEMLDVVYNAGDSVVDGLVNYIDAVVRRERGRLEDPQVDQAWGTVEVFVKAVRQKDKVEALYRTRLARRLLTVPYPDTGDADGRPAAEVTLLSRLKQTLAPGHGATRALEDMLRDMGNSRSATVKWEQRRQGSPRGKAPGVHFMVLTSNAWPAFAEVRLTLPRQLQEQCTSFEQFYKGMHTGRNLRWHHGVGRAWIVCQLGRRHELQVTLAQATLLLCCLSNKDQATYQEICEAVCAADDPISQREVRRGLSALVAHRILRAPSGCDPRKAVIDPGAVFYLNTAFSCKQGKLNVSVSSKQTAADDDDDGKARVQIDKGRMAALEAAIVRVMKSRKTLTLNQLVSQTVMQVSGLFTPEVQHIKRRVEDLIERQYLERDDADHSKFHYLA